MTEQMTPDQADQQQSPVPTGPVDVFKEISEAVGKNYSDKDALVKALTEKDNFIETLKKENEDTRGLVDSLANKVDESINAQKVLEELSKRPEPSDAIPAQPVDKSTITNLFQELMTSHDREQTSSKNFETVNKKLSDLYGEKAESVFKERAAQTGLSLAKVKELAAESPQAVFSLLGITGDKKVNAALPPAGNGGGILPAAQSTPYADFKAEMKAKGLNMTHPAYIMEMNKRNLFND